MDIYGLELRRIFISVRSTFVIDRSRRGVCCILVLILQFVLLPIATIGAAEMLVGGAEPKSAPSKDFDQPKSSVQNIPPRTIDSSQDSPPPQKID